MLLCLVKKVSSLSVFSVKFHGVRETLDTPFRLDTGKEPKNIPAVRNRKEPTTEAVRSGPRQRYTGEGGTDTGEKNVSVVSNLLPGGGRSY